MKHEALIKRLETTCFGLDPVDPLRLLVDDVIAALAQPEQEPICPDCKAEVLYECVACSSNNYPPPQRTEQEPQDWKTPPKEDAPLVKWAKEQTTPPQRKPLTDKAITKVIDSMPRGINGWMIHWDLYEFAQAIEAAHGIKENT